MNTRIFKRKGNWYYISTRVNAAHNDLYTLLMFAKSKGE